MKSLVIVESPAKAKTIAKYLGKDYTVKASVGHIMDLPKSKLGVDIENNFEPKYIVIKGKAPVVKELKTAAKKADRILIATDPDREGEAIAAHVAEVISGSIKHEEVYRVLFPRTARPHRHRQTVLSTASTAHRCRRAAKTNPTRSLSCPRR